MLFARTKKVISILFPVCIMLLVLVVFGSFVMTASSSPDVPLINSPISKIRVSQIEVSHSVSGVATNDYLFFLKAPDALYEGSELWRTNRGGTNASLVKDFSEFRTRYIYSMLAFNNAVIFPAYDACFESWGCEGYYDFALWYSDGTETGTYRLMDYYDGRIDILNILISDKVAYFSVYATRENYNGLWKTDGSPNGTIKIHEFYDDKASYDYYAKEMFLRSTDNNLFLIVNGRSMHELWRSDGTKNGTKFVSDLGHNYTKTPRFLMEINGNVLFSSDDVIHGRELWVTDGTPTGTRMLKDINLGTLASNPLKLGELNGNLLFAATDGIHGNELWLSDGTTSGTRLVKDINTGIENFRPIFDFDDDSKILNDLNHIVIEDRLFFYANDGIHGIELWVSDGTEVGTYLVKDIYPGTNSGIQYMYEDFHDFYNPFNPSEKLLTPGNLIFFEADDGIHGKECWQSDGTESGTFMVKDINPNGDGGCEQFHAFDNVFVFSASDDIAHQIWATNGISLETVKITEHDEAIELTPYEIPKNLEIVSFYGETTSQNNNNNRTLWALHRADIRHLFLPTVLNQVDALKVPGEIIFISDRNVGQYQVFNMADLNAKALRRVTEDAYTYGDTSCSSDGRIVVNAGLGNRDGIYLLDYATGVPTRVGDENLVGEEPVWSPDNTRFAFSREGNLFTIGVDGTNQQQLTATTAHDIDPDWSPDGSQLAFASDRSGTLQLYVMDVASQQSQALLPTWHNVKEPAWSPDGKQIAFYSDADGDNEIYVLQLATGAVAQLTDNNAHDRTPLWSPDGQWILFTSERDGNNEFYVTTPTGDKVTRLTDDPTFDWGGCWYQQP